MSTSLIPALIINFTLRGNFRRVHAYVFLIFILPLLNAILKVFDPFILNPTRDKPRDYTPALQIRVQILVHADESDEDER